MHSSFRSSLRPVSSLLVALTLSVVGAAPRARAVPDLPEPWTDRPLTLEVKQVEVTELYRLIAELAGAPVRVDSCVQRKSVDLKLENAPLSVVLDVLALKLGAYYVIEDGVLVARCGGKPALPVKELVPTRAAAPDADARALARRVTLALKDADPKLAFQTLADATGTALVVFNDAPIAGRVTLELHNVSVRTALLVLTETLELEHEPNIVDGELLVAPQRRPPAAQP